VGKSSTKARRFTASSIKITPGSNEVASFDGKVTELSRVRVPIDLVACFLDVGSSYPGSAHFGCVIKRNRVQNSQGWGCSPIKRERELGLDRRETGRILSTGLVG
jgi:hypothetical protein